MVNSQKNLYSFLIMTFQVTAAKCSKVGEQAVKSIHCISIVPDTVQNYRITANMSAKEVVSIKS